MVFDLRIFLDPLPSALIFIFVLFCGCRSSLGCSGTVNFVCYDILCRSVCCGQHSCCFRTFVELPYGYPQSLRFGDLHHQPSAGGFAICPVSTCYGDLRGVLVYCGLFHCRVVLVYYHYISLLVVNNLCEVGSWLVCFIHTILVVSVY